MKTTMKKLEQLWNMLEYYEIATEDEIRLVTDINGYNEQALLDILYCRTGYRSFEQMFDELENE